MNLNPSKDSSPPPPLGPSQSKYPIKIRKPLDRIGIASLTLVECDYCRWQMIISGDTYFAFKSFDWSAMISFLLAPQTIIPNNRPHLQPLNPLRTSAAIKQFSIEPRVRSVSSANKNWACRFSKNQTNAPATPDKSN